MTEFIQLILSPKAFAYVLKAVEPRIFGPLQPLGESGLLPIPPRVPRVVVIVVPGPAVPPTGIVIPSPPIVVVVMVMISLPAPMVIRPSGAPPALRRAVTAMVSLIATAGELSPYLLNGRALEGMSEGFARVGLGQGFGAGSPSNRQDRSSQEKNFEALG